MINNFHSVLLTPFDTLFFRDHRPFEAGVQKYSQPLFPTPLTFMGALSQAYFEKTVSDKQAFLNGIADPQLGKYDPDLTNQSQDNFCIKGLFVIDGEAIFIPMPANLLTQKKYNKKDSNYEIKAILPEKKCKLRLPVADFEYRPGYLRLEEFIQPEDEVEFSDFQGPLHEEKRVGIGIDRQTNSTEEGALYFTTHTRLKQDFDQKSSFMICYQTGNQAQLKMANALRLGGENRLVYTDQTSIKSKLDKRLGDFVDALRKKLRDDWENKTFRFVVYLLTPAIFKKGWQPGSWPWNDRAELISACVPKPIWISGFRIIRGRGGEPRPLHKAAPAGSVYFFESQHEDLKNELINEFILEKSVSEIYPQAGFGMTLINSW